jgi:hypothetical protein
MERFVRGPANRETMSNAVVIATLKSLGYKELVHYPSLLQHIGMASTLGNSFGEVSGFLGVDYNLLSLPAPEYPAPRKSSRCQFQRDGDFMVCKNCNWRMRISDPSLPPEKYHARCGGADCRANSERRSVRESRVKRRHDSAQRATTRQSFKLGTLMAKVLKKIGIKQKSGCGCGRREKTLNRWGQNVIRMFRFW